MDNSVLSSNCELCDDYTMLSLSDTVNFKCSKCDLEVYKALCKQCALLAQQHQCHLCYSKIVAVPDRSALQFVLEQVGLPIQLEALALEHDRTYMQTGPNTVEKPEGGHEKIGPYSRGGHVYYLPAGWTRHGLCVDDWSEMEDWNIGFVGCKGLKVKSLVESVQPKVKERSATAQVELMNVTALAATRFSLQHSPAIATPSVEYASCSAFSQIVKIPSFRDVWCSIVFQCRVRPGSFDVRGESVGSSMHGDKQFDPHFANSDLEWWVNDSTDIKIDGLLTKLSFGEPPVDYSGGCSPVVNGLLPCMSLMVRCDDDADPDKQCILCSYPASCWACAKCSHSMCKDCIDKIDSCPQCEKIYPTNTIVEC
mmetsp:Transcript_119314/g.210956  ORF Transcript_119314/g.210956 Transcript_119314/m.210956 type:complete len:367 (+) Transcript_119314:88-1188(+)